MNRGFTITELAVVLIIASILVVLSIPTYKSVMVTARRGEAKVNLSHIDSLQSVFKVAGSNFTYGTIPKANPVGYASSGCSGSGWKNELGFRPNRCGELRYQYWSTGGSDFTAVAYGPSDTAGKYIYPDCDGSGASRPCGSKSYSDGDGLVLTSSSGKINNCRNILEFCPGGGGTPITGPPGTTPTPPPICTGCSAWGAWTPSADTECPSVNVNQTSSCNNKTPAGCTGTVADQTQTVSGTKCCQNEECERVAGTGKWNAGTSTCNCGAGKSWDWTPSSCTGSCVTTPLTTCTPTAPTGNPTLTPDPADECIGKTFSQKGTLTNSCSDACPTPLPTCTCSSKLGATCTCSYSSSGGKCTQTNTYTKSGTGTKGSYKDAETACNSTKANNGSWSSGTCNCGTGKNWGGFDTTTCTGGCTTTTTCTPPAPTGSPTLTPAPADECTGKTFSQTGTLTSSCSDACPTPLPTCTCPSKLGATCTCSYSSSGGQCTQTNTYTKSGTGTKGSYKDAETACNSTKATNGSWSSGTCNCGTGKNWGGFDTTTCTGGCTTCSNCSLADNSTLTWPANPDCTGKPNGEQDITQTQTRTGNCTGGVCPNTTNCTCIGSVGSNCSSCSLSGCPSAGCLTQGYERIVADVCCYGGVSSTDSTFTTPSCGTDLKWDSTDCGCICDDTKACCDGTNVITANNHSCEDYEDWKGFNASDPNNDCKCDCSITDATCKGTPGNSNHRPDKYLDTNDCTCKCGLTEQDCIDIGEELDAADCKCQTVTICKTNRFCCDFSTNVSGDSVTKPANCPQSATWSGTYNATAADLGCCGVNITSPTCSCSGWTTTKTPKANTVCAGESFTQTRTYKATCSGAGCQHGQCVSQNLGAGCTCTYNGATNEEEIVCISTETGTKGKTKEKACTNSSGKWDSTGSSCTCKYPKNFDYDDTKCGGGCRCNTSVNCNSLGRLLDPASCRCRCDWESKCQGLTDTNGDSGQWDGIGFDGECTFKDGSKFERTYSNCSAKAVSTTPPPKSTTSVYSGCLSYMVSSLFSGLANANAIKTHCENNNHITTTELNTAKTKIADISNHGSVGWTTDNDIIPHTEKVFNCWKQASTGMTATKKAFAKGIVDGIIDCAENPPTGTTGPFVTITLSN